MEQSLVFQKDGKGFFHLLFSEAVYWLVLAHYLKAGDTVNLECIVLAHFKAKTVKRVAGADT